MFLFKPSEEPTNVKQHGLTAHGKEAVYLEERAQLYHFRPSTFKLRLRFLTPFPDLTPFPELLNEPLSEAINAGRPFS